MEGLFSLADRAFLWASSSTGLGYELLNILFYCFLVPGIWCTILLVRLRSGASAAVLALHLAMAVLFVTAAPESLQNEFYARCLRQLHAWGSATSRSYTTIAVLAGVPAPVLATALLVFAPRRFLPLLFALEILLLFSVLFCAWFFY